MRYLLLAAIISAPLSVQAEQPTESKCPFSVRLLIPAVADEWPFDSKKDSFRNEIDCRFGWPASGFQAIIRNDTSELQSIDACGCYPQLEHNFSFEIEEPDAAPWTMEFKGSTMCRWNPCQSYVVKPGEFLVADIPCYSDPWKASFPGSWTKHRNEQYRTIRIRALLREKWGQRKCRAESEWVATRLLFRPLEAK